MPLEPNLLERLVLFRLDRGPAPVLDQWEGSGRSPVGRAGLRFVALTYQATLGAETYSEAEVEAWLREAGFSDVRRRSVGPLSGTSIVEATKA